MYSQIHNIFIVLIIVAFSSPLCCGIRNLKSYVLAVNTFNVNDYGAVGDGESDDSKAFLKAWEEACSSSNAVFLVPNNQTYLLKPITFKGPCTSPLKIQIAGNISASNDRSDYKENFKQWVVFKSIHNLTIEAPGSMDGNGNIWWENSCKIDKKKPCTDAPTAVVFQDCNYLVVTTLKIQNAQQMHVSFDGCNNVMATDIHISSPENSPNTDGIHITYTRNIHVTDANIGTGDDCISIVDGTQIVRAKNITCGPGHGISVGSLGDNNSKVHVSDIIVNGATISGTTNGARIKTWQGGSGTASDIKFQNIILKDVANPIIIDQNYCDKYKPCKNQSSAVQVKNVLYQNIQGTSYSEYAVKFDCSPNYPCEEIIMEDIQIQRINGNSVGAFCDNVHLAKVVDVSPMC